MLRLATWLLTLSYPFLVYFSMGRIQPRYLALILGAFLLLRWQQAGFGELRDSMMWLLPAGLLLMGAVVLTNQGILLLAYPVLVNALFFGLFLFSLIRPPTIVEKLARLTEPELPERGIAYTRKVTIVWCAFFLGNGLAAAGTWRYGDPWIWSLYNGLVSYLLMGILMLTEWCIRQRVRRSF